MAQDSRQWLMLCPKRKNKDGSPKEPTEPELNSISSDRDQVRKIRSRLSDISWWMRLTSQRIAKRANREDEETGKFWQSRYKAVRLIDEESILACSAYVDLNPIGAAIAETLEASNHTSVQRRIETLRTSLALAAQGTFTTQKTQGRLIATRESEAVRTGSTERGLAVYRARRDSVHR